MSRESPEPLSRAAKGRLSDLELFRRAQWDEEAFEILVGRLSYIRLAVQEWCLPQKLADDSFMEIARAAIDAAVKYALSASDEAVRAMNRPDWFQRLAYVEFRYWLRQNQPEARLPPPPARRDTLSPEARKARRQHELKARRCLDWIKIREHRAIIELVMIRNLSPEEAGRRLGMIPSVAIIVYRDALAEVRALMREQATDSETIAEQSQLLRDLERMETKVFREVLFRVLGEGQSSEEAAAAMGRAPEEGEHLLLEAMKELERLRREDDDFRHWVI